MVYYTIERRQFIAHAQERIARKVATTSTPERLGREGYQPRSNEPIVCLLHISIAKLWGYVKDGRYDKIIPMINCITCKTKLIPIVYGRLDPEILEMQDKGLLLISLDKTRSANSYCPLCEQAYGDYTFIPQIPFDFQEDH